ncbi:metal-sensitive transcriptional regulator [Brevibacillus fluminis]|uniref:Metal-sensitive transcriptional regulator n=1 Tax=Brevibacillus fluminis TaxID=511487 RepID=A0A3M8D483_9BACL|nr:metal-sensing transcriptional repressor [Brevibacillus fluminis]RNB82401.1 metal-sensitive transcriptional regulator [Brevibacillus fluminis]
MDYQYGEDIKRRLLRIEGQVRGVLKMMEEQRNCKEVVAQLTAIRNASDKAIAQIVAENLQRCLLEEQASGKDTGSIVREAVDLLVKSR